MALWGSRCHEDDPERPRHLPRIFHCAIRGWHPVGDVPPAAAQTVALFALSAVNRLFILLVCVLALVRYRSAISFLFALLILNYLAGQLLLQFLPVTRSGTPPGPFVNLVLFVLMGAGLALSLRTRGGGHDVASAKI